MDKSFVFMYMSCLSVVDESLSINIAFATVTFQTVCKFNARIFLCVRAEESSRPPASAVDNRGGSRRPVEMTKPSKTVPSRKPEARQQAGGGYRSGADNLPPLGAVGNGFNGVRAVKQQGK